MKKIILLAVIAFGITITSCRKERTCECRETRTEVRSGFGAQTRVDNSSTKYTAAKQKKKEFKYSSDCFSESYSYNDAGGGNGPQAWSSVITVENKCELK